MADLDPASIVARVAPLVGAGDGDPSVVAAVDAAAVLVSSSENVGGALPDDALTVQGMVGLSRALYLDALASRGANVALGDTTVDTVFTPEDIYRHWRHYFVPLAHRWGVA